MIAFAGIFEASPRIAACAPFSECSYTFGFGGGNSRAIT